MPSLNQSLAQLERSGLIQVGQLKPELEYLFRHVLVHDAAYESLLREDRQRLHQVAGLVVEQLYPGRLDELAPLLGRHFAIAGDARRAGHYFTLAGDTAFNQYANTEAVSFYSQALEQAPAIQAGGQELEHLYLRRGRALELTGRYDEALANYQELARLARERGDRALELAALVARATVLAAPTEKFDPAGVDALSEQALALARELDDKAAEARIFWNRMLASISQGRLAEALQDGERSLAIARRHNLREQLAYTLNDLCRVYFPQQVDKAWASLQEARSLWQELNNPAMLVDNLNTTALLHLQSGNFEQVIALAEEAWQTSRA
ncbi:MAG: hypothetical protein L0331_24315, partial [Chloroflexi bacterium]|nr:hypothetical protein [Chloroflexota bacterium]